VAVRHVYPKKTKEKGTAIEPERSRKQKRAAPAEPAAALNDASLYINRELSLLAFQRRVLEEAADKLNPLLERVKFLSIVGSNLNEFFMVRVAGLISQMEAGITESGPDGMPPRAQLIAIRREVKRLIAEAYKCLSGLYAELAEAGIQVLDYSSLSEVQSRVAHNYFTESAFPVLTPLAFDPGRPFPHISNLSLNLAALIRDRQGNERFARIKVPDSLPPLVPVNRAAAPKQKRSRSQAHLEFVWLEQVIAAHLAALFPGMEVLETHPFHVTRDADMAIKELEAEDLLESIEEGVRQRRFGSVVRLMVGEDMPPHVLEILINNLEVDATEIYRIDGPLSLSRLMHLYNLDRPDLKDAPFLPALPAALAQVSPEDDLLSLIGHQDILLHHPYESFQPVIDFLKKAAHDPSVLTIKICLYRVGRNSPVVQALLEAIEEEKQVAALVELKARFDEESNIEWARALEAEGVHVVYGLVGLKIHCKVALVVRREGDHIARYVHLSTGNYNAVTAHLYTDIGMFTADGEVSDDVTHLFNYLTGYSAKADYKRLLVAPVNLRARMTAMIEREIAHGNKGQLIFKTNALVDPEMIQLLYRASQAGVQIQLLVRGICCLRPGIAGISEHIQVTSIVGRFLEHSRVYYFHNNGDEQVYLGSADLMPRNLDHRVEILFPLADANLISRVRDELLKGYLSDTVKARRMLSDGAYVHKKPASGKRPFNCQEAWIPKRRSAESHNTAETLVLKNRPDD
jgi:polyphosphate kinase